MSIGKKLIFCAVGIIYVIPAQAIAFDDFSSDPFAGETPLTDDELQEHRGGFSFGGFVLEFGVDFLTGLAPVITQAGQIVPVETIGGALNFNNGVSFDPATSTWIINNTLDNVTVSQTLSMDVIVSNFDLRVAQAFASSVTVTLSPQQALLAPLN
jgi:hypothetical protein